LAGGCLGCRPTRRRRSGSTRTRARRHGRCDTRAGGRDFATFTRAGSELTAPRPAPSTRAAHVAMCEWSSARAVARHDRQPSARPPGTSPLVDAFTGNEELDECSLTSSEARRGQEEAAPRSPLPPSGLAAPCGRTTSFARRSLGCGRRSTRPCAPGVDHGASCTGARCRATSRARPSGGGLGDAPECLDGEAKS